MIRLLIITVLALPLTVLARLGETREQIEARYGKPVSGLAHDGIGYRYQGLQIGVVYGSTNSFVHGKSMARCSIKETISAGPGGFSLETLHDLFEVNKGNSEWVCPDHRVGHGCNTADEERESNLNPFHEIRGISFRIILDKPKPKTVKGF